MRSARPLLLLACLLAAGGCTRLEAIMAPSAGETVADMRVLDGGYAGNATYADGPQRCPRRLSLSITVANGQATGEVFDPASPNTAASRFDGFLESDGGISTIVRALGDIYVLRGRFREGRFDGRLLAEAAIDPRRNNPRQGETNLRLSSGSGNCAWAIRAPQGAR
ncbi:MAG: hypothetical protein ACKOUS_14415 [Alphaproteobacteria bacterium]